MLPQRVRERLVLESHNCEVKQHFGSTWKNMQTEFHEQQTAFYASRICFLFTYLKEII